MKNLIDFIKTKHKKTLAGMALISLLLASLGIAVALKHTHKKAIVAEQPSPALQPTSKEHADSEIFKENIKGTLSAIDQRLSRVQKEIEKSALKDPDEAPAKALNALSQTITNFKTEAECSLLKSHEENEVLAKKIQALQEVIASLKGNEPKIQYLDKKALPFEVMAIDSVNEASVLALRYKHNHLSLEEGEKLAGWKLIHIDYAKQFAEFDDEQGVHVKLSLLNHQKAAKSWA